MLFVVNAIYTHAIHKHNALLFCQYISEQKRTEKKRKKEEDNSINNHLKTRTGMRKVNSKPLFYVRVCRCECVCLCIWSEITMGIVYFYPTKSNKQQPKSSRV